MGNNYSSLQRSRDMVCDLKSVTMNGTIDFYSSQSFLKRKQNNQIKGCGTIDIDNDVFKKAFINIIKLTGLTNLNILEVGSGNGHNSLFVKTLIEKELKINPTFIATDLQEHSDQEMKILKLSSERAVRHYGDKSNILLLISPPPNCYMDYYAISEFESSTSDPKYIIYFGELGASDGGVGMYQYMMNLSKWNLVQRDMIYKMTDSYGGPLEKELFLFKYDSSKVPRSVHELYYEIELKNIREFINEDNTEPKFTPDPDQYNTDSIPELETDSIPELETELKNNDTSSDGTSLEQHLEKDQTGMAIDVLKKLMDGATIEPELLELKMVGNFNNGKSHVKALLEDVFKEYQEYQEQ